MSEVVKIELTPQAEKILRHMTNMPQSMLVDIAKGMQRANVLMVSRIQEERLTGDGPFPVEEHKLGVRTGRLGGSLRSGETMIGDSKVESSIGSNVKYAAVHEFGLPVHHPARVGKLRLKTNRGNLVRQEGYSHLAVFARRRGKAYKEVGAIFGEYTQQMPERAPVRTGIAEHLGEYGQMVSQAIEDSWNALSGGGAAT